MPLKAFIITQEDCLYLPQFIHTVLRHRRANLAGMTILPALMPKQTWTSTMRDHLAVYGPTQFFRQGVRYACRRGLAMLQRYVPLPGYYSVEGVAKEYELPLHPTKSVNSKEYLDFLRSLDLDVIISINASQKFKSEILALPRLAFVVHKERAFLGDDRYDGLVELLIESLADRLSSRRRASSRQRSSSSR